MKKAKIISRAELSKIPSVRTREREGYRSRRPLRHRRTRLGTNPARTDSDKDGFGDFEELKNGFNPLGKGRLPINEKFAEKYRNAHLRLASQNDSVWFVSSKTAKRTLITKLQT